MDKTNQELAEIAAKLGENDALRTAKSAVEVAQKNQRQAQTALQDIDLEVKGLAAKIAGQEKKLYSGTVLNAKEAANLQDEVASLKRWHEQREEALLEAMLTAEEADETLLQAQADLARITATWENDQKELIEKQNHLKTKRTHLKERRPDIIEHITSDDLSHYEKLRSKKGGRAVALVEGGVCRGCGISPSSNKIQRARAGNELAYCGACGRILYVP
jgi:predicted  nucleic acid-binding Zn-ribbon protein